jgi:hypothetical protein
MSKDLATPILKKSAVDEKGIIHYLIEGGMTKREVFAGQAMQGLLTNSFIQETGMSMIGVAMDAVEAADALIAELEKKA